MTENKQIYDDKKLDDLAKTLAKNVVDSTSSITTKTVNSAGYDKSYSCVILGVNQIFCDDVNEEAQARLIKAYDIPAASTTVNYYTVEINGIYYCIKQNAAYSMRQVVNVVAPKGNMNGLYIGTAGGNKSGTSNESATNILDQIKFTAGRAYYNGEEYVLQRGNNRRIIAVSKGTDRCSLIDTEPYGTEAENEIAAATAILSGLETRSTVEFTFTNNVEGYMISSPARFDDEANVSIDWGDGTTENTLENSHQYPVGTFIVKISAPNATVITSTSTFLGWSNKNDNVMYIGGSVEEVYGNVDYVAKLVFGEGVKRIKGYFGVDDYPLLDFSVPPCVEEIDYLYGKICSNYIYIPSTCISIGSTSGCERLTKVEISSDGSELKITDSDAFIGGYYNKNTDNPTAVIHHFSLPARCSFTQNNPQLCWRNYVRFFRFERGITAIPENLLSHSLDAISRVYIPKTVTSIGYDAMRTRTVVFEGSSGEWDKIEKANADGWGWNNGLECTTILYGAEYYDAFEADIVRDWSELPQEYIAGQGIRVSDEKVISARLGEGLTINDVDAIIVDKASENKYGGIKIGKGLKVGDYEQQEDGTYLETSDTGKTLVSLGAGLEFDDNSAVTVTLGSGLEFVEKTAATADEDATYAIQPKLGNGLEFAEKKEKNPETEEEVVTYDIQPKLGAGLKFDDNGAMAVDGAAGGADISAGGGIEISTDEDEKTKIAVKCGEGCEINDNGELVTVPNIEHAIFISEADAKYLFHEYTQIEYIAGNKIGYGGAANPVIINGYTVAKKGDQLTALIHQTATLTSVTLGSTQTTTEHVIEAKVEATYTDGSYSYVIYDNGVKKGTYTTCDPATIGFVITWQTITSSSTEAAPYGYAYLEFWAIAKPTSSSTLSSNLISGPSRLYYVFASEAEYNAAVGLTYEPLVLTQVDETTTVV